MITATKVHTQLIAATAIIANLATRLPTAVTNARLAALDPKSRDDRPAAEDTGRRSIGEHSDPTYQQAVATIGYDERVFELFEAHLETLKLCLAHLVTFADEHAPNLGQRIRCTGGRTVDEWSDPSCANWAELTASGNTRGDGLCAACRKRRDRWERTMSHVSHE